MQNSKIDLSGKVALVTGGGRGIGATISLALAQAGADVAINYNNSQLEANKIRDKIEMIGQRSLAIKADVGDTAQCKILVQKTVEVFNRVDILVGNAGISQPHQIVDTPDEEWDRVMNVNARATFAFARDLLPGMIQRKFGRFITISSGVGRLWDRWRFWRHLCCIQGSFDRFNKGNCSRRCPLCNRERDIAWSHKPTVGRGENQAYPDSGKRTC